MKAYITKQRDGSEAPTGLPEHFDVGVILVLDTEYEVVLPALARHLMAKKRERLTSSDNDQGLQRVDDRLKSVWDFQDKPKAARGDVGRSFPLSPQESEAVARLLAEDSINRGCKLAPEEASRRYKMSLAISQCIGNAWKGLVAAGLKESEDNWRVGRKRPIAPDYL